MIIGICDDDENARKQAEYICRKCTGGENQFVIFRNGGDLLEYTGEIDLLILDIEMPDMNGIEVKNKISRLNKGPIIIFLTDHYEYAEDAFGINVMGFVRKSGMEQQMSMMLDTAENMLNHNLMIMEDICSKDVRYIRAAHNYGELVLSDGSKILMRNSLQKFEKDLQEYDFIRIHREYLINLKWVKNLGKETKFVQIEGKEVETLPVATRLRKEVKEKYKEFCRRNARYC